MNNVRKGIKTQPVVCEAPGSSVTEWHGTRGKKEVVRRVSERERKRKRRREVERRGVSKSGGSKEQGCHSKAADTR